MPGDRPRDYDSYKAAASSRSLMNLSHILTSSHSEPFQHSLQRLRSLHLLVLWSSFPATSFPIYPTTAVPDTTMAELAFFINPAILIAKRLTTLYERFSQATEDLDDNIKHWKDLVFTAKAYQTRLCSYGLSPSEIDNLETRLSEFLRGCEVARARLPTKRNGKYRLRDRLAYSLNLKPFKRDLERSTAEWKGLNAKFIFQLAALART